MGFSVQRHQHIREHGRKIFRDDQALAVGGTAGEVAVQGELPPAKTVSTPRCEIRASAGKYRRAVNCSARRVAQPVSNAAARRRRSRRIACCCLYRRDAQRLGLVEGFLRKVTPRFSRLKMMRVKSPPVRA